MLLAYAKPAQMLLATRYIVTELELFVMQKRLLGDRLFSSLNIHAPLVFYHEFLSLPHADCTRVLLPTCRCRSKSALHSKSRIIVT